MPNIIEMACQSYDNICIYIYIFPDIGIELHPMAGLFLHFEDCLSKQYI